MHLFPIVLNRNVNKYTDLCIKKYTDLCIKKYANIFLERQKCGLQFIIHSTHFYSGACYNENSLSWDTFWFYFVIFSQLESLKENKKYHSTLVRYIDMMVKQRLKKIGLEEKTSKKKRTLLTYQGRRFSKKSKCCEIPYLWFIF